MTQPGADAGVVLIVEDDDPVRLLMAEMLRAGGFQPVEARDGASALSVALEHLPDAILLDIALPGADGLEVLDRLKREPLLAAIPVIMVTASGRPEHVERALHSGAHDYVRKPFEGPELVERVEAAVRIKARHDAARAPAEAADLPVVDPLTGLPNRRAIEIALDRALAGHPSTGVVVLDLDGLRAINGAHGAPAGDAVLCDVAARLRLLPGDGLTAGRWGGDEFVVIAAGAGAEQTAELAGRLREEIARRPLSIPGGAIEVTVSIGHAAGAGTSAASLLAAADAELRRAKSGAGQPSGASSSRSMPATGMGTQSGRLLSS